MLQWRYWSICMLHLTHWNVFMLQCARIGFLTLYHCMLLCDIKIIMKRWTVSVRRRESDQSQTDGWKCYYRLLTITLIPIQIFTICDGGPIPNDDCLIAAANVYRPNPDCDCTLINAWDDADCDRCKFTEPNPKKTCAYCCCRLDAGKTHRSWH